jgi:hypothetical protein
MPVEGSVPEIEQYIDEDHGAICSVEVYDPVHIIEDLMQCTCNIPKEDDGQEKDTLALGCPGGIGFIEG